MTTSSRRTRRSTPATPGVPCSTPRGGAGATGFATPITLVRELLPQLKDKGRVSRGWLGLAIAPVTPDLARRLNRPTRDGAVVGEVTPGGAGPAPGVGDADGESGVPGRGVARGGGG